MFGNSWFESVTGYPSITAPDVDDGTVFDLWGGATDHSTYADLILPPGSTIEKAYLYVERAFASQLTSEVKLGVPSASGYTTQPR